VTVGSATVPGAKVTAEVVGQGRGPKVTIFKYKSKTRQRSKTGHRQPYTRLAIQEIVTAEKKPAEKRPAAKKPAEKKPAAKRPAEKKPATPKRTRSKVESKQGEEIAESKPKRAPRKKAASHGT
jgi:hypothetical protein